MELHLQKAVLILGQPHSLDRESLFPEESRKGQGPHPFYIVFYEHLQQTA